LRHAEFDIHDNAVIQDRDINNLPLDTYTRGNDMSGSLQGAGGIGGLLARTDNGLLTVGFSSPHAYYHADGNGNITVLINTNQAIVAKYLYDPFGNILSQSGSLADANLYRFSSKEFHKNSRLVYYLYRFYDPNVQRWLNRDPLGDSFNSLLGILQHRLVRGRALQLTPALLRLHPGNLRPSPFERLGNPNLFEFDGNDPVVAIDPTGLEVLTSSQIVDILYQATLDGDYAAIDYWEGELAIALEQEAAEAAAAAAARTSVWGVCRAIAVGVGATLVNIAGALGGLWMGPGQGLGLGNLGSGGID
jgi:RHS repeat-associated protein